MNYVDRVWKSINAEIACIVTEVQVWCLLLVSRSYIDSICILSQAAEKLSSGNTELHLIFTDPKKSYAELHGTCT